MSRGEIALAASRLTKSFLILIQAPERKSRIRVPLRRRYRRLTVLDEVSFSIREGEVFGVIGRNGAGKSTLLRLLAGIYEPDSGIVFSRGNSVSMADLSAGFNPKLSVRENVIMKGVMLGLSRNQIKSRFQHIIDFAEIGGFEAAEFASSPRG